MLAKIISFLFLCPFLPSPLPSIQSCIFKSHSSFKAQNQCFHKLFLNHGWFCKNNIIYMQVVKKQHPTEGHGDVFCLVSMVLLLLLIKLHFSTFRTTYTLQFPYCLSLKILVHWRRKWQPTPVFLPGESQGWRNLVGCHLWGRTELDRTEVT